MTFKHDFAISFAGEVREIAEQIANLLTEKGAKVFYDRYSEGDMLGKKLSTYFHKQYGGDTRYLIILISKEYPQKDWTNLELSIARDEAKKRKEEFILPIRLDDTKILGIHDDIGFIDYREKGIERTIEILWEKLNIEVEEDEHKAEILSEKEIKDKAKELLSKLNKISTFDLLTEFYEFLLKINEKEEIKWVEVELSGDFYEVGKDDPEYFKYRGVKGYISPVKIATFGFATLDMIVAEPKYLMKPLNYILSMQLFELERYANNLDGIGIITLNERAKEILGLDNIDISEFYFYFKSSDVVRIISKIKQKISSYLIKIIKS